MSVRRQGFTLRESGPAERCCTRSSHRWNLRRSPFVVMRCIVRALRVEEVRTRVKRHRDGKDDIQLSVSLDGEMTIRIR
jgi:hypothetical protein